LFFSLEHHHKKKQRHIVVVFFFSNIEKTKHIRKQQKETKRRKGTYLQAPTLPSHFWFLLLPSRFCTSISSAFSPNIFFSKTKEKKNINKKKFAEKGRSLPSSSHSAFSFLAPASGLPLLHFHFKCFLLASFFSQVEEKKNTKKKKTIEKKKNAEKGGSLPSSSHSAFSLLAPTFAFLLLHFHFKHFLLTSSQAK
jgi:hypothetical protein